MAVVVHRIASQLTSGIAHAFGWTAAEQHLRQLERDLAAGAIDGFGVVVVLDFSGIEAVSASYVKRSLLWLLSSGERFARGEQNDADLPRALNIFPVVCGLTDEVRSEIKLVLEHQRRSCLESIEINQDMIGRARLLGSLDPALRATLMRVVAAGETTAAHLFERSQEGGPLGVTGWNNRLADLYEKRLVRRRKQGRFWLVSSLTKELLDG